MTRNKLLSTSLLSLGVLALGCLPTFGQNNSSPKPEFNNAVGFAVSAPLRDLAKLPPTPQYGFHEAAPVRRIPRRPVGAVVDTVEQSIAGSGSNFSIGLNFLGVGNGFPGYSVPDAPPDTNMAVGDTQIVQWVNVSYAVFNKSNGAILAGPIEGNVIWQALGGPCYANNSGDILAQYDKANHRFVLSQNVFSGPPYYTCIAVSTTPDALGSYYLYSFQQPGTAFPDYPKIGVWSNGYYQTENMFTSGFVGGRLCAFNSAKLLVGDSSAEQICFQLTPNDGGILPADIDSAVGPPANEDELFASNYDSSNLSVYSMHPVFSNPSQSTVTGSNGSQLIPVPAYTPACNGSYGGACVPQKGVTDKLDVLGDRLMYRLAYWDDNPLVSVHATPPKPLPTQHWYILHDSTASGGNEAPRWYEFQAPQKALPVTAISLFQSGTFAPDSNYRWMGSIARDKAYDLLMGYSVSSSSMYPSIAITGRTLSDPLGTMEGELTVISGSGSQPDTSNRWGDYSSTRIDADGCTFWYTTEFYMVTQRFDWSTQINSAKFANCN